MRTLFFSLLLILSFSAQAAQPKIGLVLVDKILADAPQIEAINAEMLKRFSGQRDELKKMEDEIKKLQDDYKRNELVMTQDKLDELRNKIIAGVQSFKQKEAQLNQEVSAMRAEKLTGLQQMIKGIIEDIAKEEKYDIILSDGVVYTTDKYDITDKVLKAMKKKFK